MEKPKKNQNTGWSVAQLREKIADIVAARPKKEGVAKGGRKRGRGYTKAVHNFRHAKMRRKMAKETKQAQRRGGRN